MSAPDTKLLHQIQVSRFRTKSNTKSVDLSGPESQLLSSSRNLDGHLLELGPRDPLMTFKGIYRNLKIFRIIWSVSTRPRPRRTPMTFKGVSGILENFENISKNLEELVRFYSIISDQI